MRVDRGLRQRLTRENSGRRSFGLSGQLSLGCGEASGSAHSNEPRKLEHRSRHGARSTLQHAGIPWNRISMFNVGRIR
jgi:hypothetical protein